MLHCYLVLLNRVPAGAYSSDFCCVLQAEMCYQQLKRPFSQAAPGPAALCPQPHTHNMVCVQLCSVNTADVKTPHPWMF
ncbi:hypothetical protein GDO81_002427 [Engystomops pustulosus]|uniref:Secreted protein n=1 Tax=Engystomops pustulosus TaxID=76066 RepID=A0AAV7DLV5_ENGPU|nr:hypothetical protein GDO81_002427 [Engystomops pustulosus]